MKRKTSLERSFDTVSFRDSLRMRTTSKKIKLSLTRFSKNQVYITVEYLKMTARSKSNSSGGELGHLVKVSQGSILAVVRSSETTIKSFGRVSKITNSSGGRVSFKEENFIFNFSPVNVLVF